MDIMTLKQSPHLSASSINDYLSCGLMFKLSRIDHVKPMFTPAELEFGSAIHNAFEKFYKFKRDGKRLFKTELLLEFELHWTERVKDNIYIKFRDGKTFESMLEEAKALLTLHQDMNPPNDLEVLMVEEAFAFKLEGVDVPIIGVFDLVEKDPSNTILVTDWKTSSKAYSSTDIDENMQMLLYQMALRTMGYENHEILLKLDVLIKTKTPKVDAYFTTRSEKDENRLAKKIQAVWQGIQNEIFIPSDGNWKCTNCPYKDNFCKEW